MAAWLRNLSDRGLAVQTALLGAAVLAVFGLVGPIAGYVFGTKSLAAAAAAGLLCYAGALVGMVIRHSSKLSLLPVAAFLAGMSARMGIPLVSAFAIHLHRGPLAEAGLLYYLVVFYLVTLAADVALSLPNGRQPSPAGRADTNPGVVA
jgi:hypothetical protein